MISWDTRADMFGQARATLLISLRCHANDGMMVRMMKMCPDERLMGRLNYQQWGCNQTKTLLRVISTLTYHPGIFSGILSVLPYFDILSSIPAGIYSDILADMCSGLPPSIRRCTLVQISRPDRDPHLAEITRFHQQVMGRVQLTSQSRFVRRRSAMQRLDAIGTDMVTRKI